MDIRKIAERVVLGDEVLKTPKSKPQKIFKKVVDEFIDRQNELEKEMDLKNKIEDLSYMYPYAFHDAKTVSVDADLYDILRDGYADFGIGEKMYQKLMNELEKAGYYLEDQGQGVYVFAQ